MTDSTQRQGGGNRQNLESWRGLEDVALDHALDAVLTKYAAAEPISGLEDRILANLRIEQESVTRRSWWRWPAVTALAAVIVVTVALVWKSGRPTPNITARRPPATSQSNDHAGTQVANDGGTGSIPPHRAGSGKRLKPPAVSPPVAVVVPVPKLDQFPSPQPLSEQEKILSSFVTQFQEQAVLIARFHEEDLRRDRMELIGNAQSKTSNTEFENEETKLR